MTLVLKTLFTSFLATLMTNFAFSQEVTGFLTSLVKRECMIVYLPSYPMVCHVPHDVLLFPYTYDSSKTGLENVSLALNSHSLKGYDVYFQVLRNSQKRIRQMMEDSEPIKLLLSHEITSVDEGGNITEVYKDVCFLFGTFYFTKYKGDCKQNAPVQNLYGIILEDKEVMLLEYSNYMIGVPIAFIPNGQSVPDDEALKTAEEIKN